MALQNPEQAKLFTQYKPSKYGNKRIELDGHRLDSIAEAAFYVGLKKQNSVFWIHPSFRFRCGIIYIADFVVNTWTTKEDFLPINIGAKWDSNNSAHIEWWTKFKDCWSVVDVKGVETSAFKIKRRLLKNEFGIDIQIERMDSKQALALVNGYIGEKTCQHSLRQAVSKPSCALPSSDRREVEKHTPRSQSGRAWGQRLR